MTTLPQEMIIQFTDFPKNRRSTTLRQKALRPFKDRFPIVGTPCNYRKQCQKDFARIKEKPCRL